MLSNGSSEKAIDFVNRSSTKMIVFNDLFPRFRYFRISLYENFIIWCALFSGLMLAPHKFNGFKQGHVKKVLVFFAFPAPLMTLLFYRNAFPYYYVFILAPAIVFCGMVFYRVVENFKKKPSTGNMLFIVFLPCLVFFNFIYHYNQVPPKQLSAQNNVIETVHKIFPRPVCYIDRCSAVSSFKKVGFFMSTWGFENYKTAGQPIMYDILTGKAPVFLLANIKSLDISNSHGIGYFENAYALFEDDWRILKANYIQHWGDIFIAGKEFEFGPETDEQEFEILLPGVYTVETDDAVLINGQPHRFGSLVDLKKGTHHIKTIGQNDRVTLRWGNNIYRPSSEQIPDNFFKGFRR